MFKRNPWNSDKADMRALSIRQPYAELILRGIKPIEFRSRPTKRIGERFYIYASQQWASGKLFLEGCRLKVQSDECRVQNEDRLRVTSDNLEVPKDGPEKWMLELAKMLILKDLPTGVIVGTASIKEVVKGDSLYEWHLTDVERAKRFRKPRGHPQPVWFTPF
jgi:predicted transcriptional regulator